MSPAVTHRVVVGVDGSSGSLSALRMAATEAEQRHAVLLVVYAAPVRHPHSAPPHAPREVTAELDGVRRGHPSLVVIERIAPMPAEWLLLDEAQRAELVVLGWPEHQVHADRHSLAESLRRRAPCRVVAASPEEGAAASRGVPQPRHGAGG